MKKCILFLMLIMSALNVYAAKINKIVFFGDSLTDDGNVYSLFLHVIPKSPPYFKGRFSSGPTWAEHVGKYYYDMKYMSYKNYALGGATAVFHLPTTKFVSPTTLNGEVDKYLLESIFNDRSKALFAIWIGGNDYLFAADAGLNKTADEVVEKTIEAMDKLRDHGAKNFLVLNLPDLASAPIAQTKSPEALHALTLLHNQKLDAAVQKFQRQYPDLTITMVNVYDTFNDLVSHPEKYNQKYNTHLTNITEACWRGGFMFSKALAGPEMARDIKQTLLADNQTLPEDFDAQAMSDYIANTPALAYTYQMSKSYTLGNVPCADSSQYLFWDSIHPTGVVHKILAEVVIEQLGNKVA